MMKNLLTTLFFCLALNMVIAQSQSRSVPIDLDEGTNARTNVFTMDVVVQGSECVGFDCATSESFGFDTERLKENNLRIHFDDTSNSASFPKRDWRIVINDTSNGGGEYFAIEDATDGRQVFRIEGGSISNALYVDSEGDVGIGTSTPVVEVHAVDGNTPTYRLEQNGSSGFAAQTWDLAGNETNFFIRDVTNGSKLPFRIKPSAPDDALFIAADGDVGMGTDAPGDDLHIRKTDATATGIDIENTNATTQNVNLRFTTPLQIWNVKSNAQGAFQIRNQTSGTNIMEVDRTSNLATFPGDVTVTGTFTNSDRRLKSDLQPFEDGLEVVARMRPVSYSFNSELKLNTDRVHYGVVAQELQKIAPYLVSESEYSIEDNDGKIVGSKSFLKIDDMAIKWLLVNAIKQQQEQIEDDKLKIENLEKEVEELSSIKSRLDELELKMDELKNGNSQNVILKGSNIGSLGQNYPNPFNNETVIEYYNASSNGRSEIQFTDMNGKILKTVIVAQGKGKINLKASELPAGNYSYSLISNGEVIHTKKMVLTR